AFSSGLKCMALLFLCTSSNRSSARRYIGFPSISYKSLLEPNRRLQPAARSIIPIFICSYLFFMYLCPALIFRILFGLSQTSAGCRNSPFFQFRTDFLCDFLIRQYVDLIQIYSVLTVSHAFSQTFFGTCDLYQIFRRYGISRRFSEKLRRPLCPVSSLSNRFSQGVQSFHSHHNICTDG